MPSGARCSGVFAAFLLSLLWTASASSQESTADKQLEEGYSYLKACNTGAALGAFTAANEAWQSVRAQCAMAYCEYRLAHYSHARRQMAQLASAPGEKCHLDKKLHEAILACEPVKRTPEQIWNELDNISQKMLTVKFALNPEELDYRRINLEVSGATLVPDAPLSAQNQNILLADSISASCRKNAAAPSQRPAPGPHFALLLDPDKEHTLSVLDTEAKFLRLVHEIKPGHIFADEIPLSRKKQNARMTLAVSYEGAQAQPARSPGSPAPDSSVLIEVFAERRRVYSGKELSLSLGPGTYEVHATAPDRRFRYESWNHDSLTLRPGEYFQEKVVFRKRSIYRKPWFWLELMGGIVAVGVAIGVPLTLSRDPHYDCGSQSFCIRP